MKSELKSHTTHSPEETENLGAQLAEKVKAGESVALIGELGAGKSTFARGFIHALGYDGPVRSPSFTLSNQYPSSPPVTHFDFYRLSDESEIVVLGIEDEVEDRIVLVEWADRFDEKIFQPNWRIRFSTVDDDDNTRNILVEKLSI